MSSDIVQSWFISMQLSFAIHSGVIRSSFCQKPRRSNSNNLELDLGAAAARRARRRVAPEQLHLGPDALVRGDARDVARREPVERALRRHEVAARDREAGLREADVERDDVVARERDRGRGHARLGRVVGRVVVERERVRVLTEDEGLVRPVREGWRERCLLAAGTACAGRRDSQPAGEPVASVSSDTAFVPAPVWKGSTAGPKARSADARAGACTDPRTVQPAERVVAADDVRLQLVARGRRARERRAGHKGRERAEDEGEAEHREDREGGS
jgi:hypothetical protein